jgi:hypothetical protein
MTTSRSVDIAPFWHRLRPIASYPLRGAALYSVIALTAFIVLLGMLPGVGWFFAIVGWLAAFKYAFEVLRATSDGRMDSPDVVLGIDDSVIWRYIALQGLTLLVPVLVAARVGMGAGLMLFAVLALAQPAAIMALAMTGSLRSALNPQLWATLIGRIGWPYLALIGLLLVMQLSAGNAGDLLRLVLPGMLAKPLGVVFTLWALFATFHLMGYLLWQYHEALGIEPKTITDAIGLPRSRDRELLDSASQLLQRGDAAEAAELLRAELRRRAVSLEVHEVYRRLLRQTDDRPGLAEHGPLMLHLLLMEKQERRALGLARESLDADPDFVALQPEDSVLLAERAMHGGQSQLAIDLLLAVLRRYPKHPEMPQWTLKAVDLLLRQPGRESQVRGLLRRAAERTEDEAIQTRIASQLAALPA